jgi:sulfonate transport system substrate-binding protein
MTGPGSLRVGRRTALAGAISLAMLATACGPGTSAQGRVRIGYQKNGTLLVAKRRGEFERSVTARTGAAVEWVEFPSGPPLLEALAVGSVDLGATGDTPPIFAQAAGSPLMYVAALPLTGAAGGILTPETSSLRTLSDLKGKRLAYTRGSSAHNIAMVALEAAGLKPDDITAVNLSPAEAAAAFAQGSLDGWIIWDPFYTLARIEQKARVLAGGESLGGSSAFILASRTFVESQPALLQDVLNGLSHEGTWAEQNKGAVAEMLAEETGLPLALMRETSKRADFLVQPMDLRLVNMQQATADRFAGLGILPKAITVQESVWMGWTR